MDFYKALVSKKRNPALPEEFDYFSKLIGGWEIEYIDKKSSLKYKGNWFFSRALEGMAVQDVIILPGYEYGTTFRVFNPETQVWNIAYCYTGKIMRLEARKEDGMIILSHIDNERRKWMFVEIEDRKFHWQDVTVKEGGKEQVDFEIFAVRI